MVGLLVDIDLMGELKPRLIVEQAGRFVTEQFTLDKSIDAMLTAVGMESENG